MKYKNSYLLQKVSVLYNDQLNNVWGAVTFHSENLTKPTNTICD